MLRSGLVSALLITCATGCIWGRNDSFTEKPSFWQTLRGVQEVDPTDEEDDEWAFVASEARGNQKLERDPDPWWQRYFMSPKARSIERNLGIADIDE